MSYFGKTSHNLSTKDFFLKGNNASFLLISVIFIAVIISDKYIKHNIGIENNNWLKLYLTFSPAEKTGQSKTTSDALNDVTNVSKYLPAAVEDQLKIKPIYKTFDWWKNSTTGVKNINDLPENAKKYLFAIEDFIGAKISSISTSPERDDTILVENPFEI